MHIPSYVLTFGCICMRNHVSIYTHTCIHTVLYRCVCGEHCICQRHVCCCGVVFARRSRFLQQGDVGMEMYFIVKGTLMEFSITDCGEEEVVRTLEMGDHFGELAILSDSRRTESVKAVSVCNLLLLSKFELDNLMVRMNSGHRYCGWMFGDRGWEWQGCLFIFEW